MTPEQLRERTGFGGTSAVLALCECADDHPGERLCEACVALCRDVEHDRQD